jgi:glycine oxidase
MMKYLVVGQGLAGTMLAHHLDALGADYKIVDSGVNVSSRVAAGIMNPIVFRRVTKSWMVDECLPYAVEEYRRLEKVQQTSFLHMRQIRRVFPTEQERMWWEEKRRDVQFTPYLGEPVENNQTPDYLDARCGSALIQQAYYVDTNVFLDAQRQFFQQKGRLIQAEFTYGGMGESYCDFAGERFDQVVFCEGYQGMNNPYFNYLPLHATKGQVLNLSIQHEVKHTEIMNRKCFILPLEEGGFKAGATYEWNSPNTELTDEARLELAEKVRQLINVPFEITGQQAGIRPTVDDRRPLMGTHPNHTHLHMFNGLGTKGYLLAPLLAKWMAEYLIHGKALPMEVQIGRFIKK